MDISRLKTPELRQVISLVEKRAKLEEAIAAIDQQLATLFGVRRVGPSPKAKKVTRGKSRVAKETNLDQAVPTRAKTQEKLATSKNSAKRKRPRGEMKKLVLGSLEKAGPNGMTVKELATILKIPSQSIHVWFSSTGKKLPGVVKKGQGHWIYSKS